MSESTQPAGVQLPKFLIETFVLKCSPLVQLPLASYGQLSRHHGTSEGAGRRPRTNRPGLASVGMPLSLMVSPETMVAT